MEPVKFFVLPRKDVEHLIDPQVLSSYEALRPGILDDTGVDIFCKNHRSDRQRWTAFELFQQVFDPAEAEAVVCMGWAELLEQSGKRELIHLLLISMAGYSPTAKLIVQWNHDTDSCEIEAFRACRRASDRFLILDFNTSAVWAGGHLSLPFWNVDTTPQWTPDERRLYKGGFIGYIGSVPVRRRMLNLEPGWIVSEARVDPPAYMKIMLDWDFALCPRGGGLSSYRLFEALQCGAIPILFSDRGVFPEDTWDGHYEEIVIRAPESISGDAAAIERLIENVDVCKMRRRIAEARESFSLAGVQRSIYKAVRGQNA